MAEKSASPQQSDLHPILRWAGGKQQLVPSLLEKLPEHLDGRTYIEPFFGAGSLFFKIKPERSLLGDANAELMHTYAAIRKHPQAVRKHLLRLVNEHAPDHYYTVRDCYNASSATILQASRFIYLNKTCFNGVYRVNKTGAFNVPVGRKDHVSVPTAKEFGNIAALLKKAELIADDYKKLLKRACKGDFVYLDPPYPALTETAYFNHYTTGRFDKAAQEDLATEVKKLHNRGVLFLMSNADVHDIRALYRGFSMSSVAVRRYITCKKKRVQVSELLIWNY